MIEYDPAECFSMGILFQLAGSVIPRNIPQASMAAVICWAVIYLAGDEPEPLSYDPYGERVMGVVLGILLVFRSAFALRRFWEARSFLCKSISNLADLGRDSKSFSEKDLNSMPTEEILKFQACNGRLLRLVLCVMFQNLTGSNHINAWKAHEYLEDHETEQLKHDPRTRPMIVMSWIIEGFIDLHHNKMLSVPPPALNNVMREAADALMFYHQALKIADTQFPFPMLQMSKILLFFFLFVTPVVVGLNAGDATQKIGLAFIVVICYFSVDAIAVELSDPFGDDANDLPLDDIMEDYNRQLSQVLPKQTKVRSTSVVGEERDPTVHQPLTLIEQNDTEWLKNNQAKIQQVLRMCHIQDLEHRKFHSEVRLDNSGPIGHAALRE